MSDLNGDLDDSVLSIGKELGPLHPDFPRDTTTERFLRIWHRAVSELDNEVDKLDNLTKSYEESKSNTKKKKVKKCETRVQIFLKTLKELKNEAGGDAVEDVRAIQNAERSLDNAEGKLSREEEDIATPSVLTQVVDTSTSALRVEDSPKIRSEAFWEIEDEGLPLDQPQGDEDLSSTDVNAFPIVNNVSQTSVVVHRSTSGVNQRQTQSSRVSIVSNASSRIDYSNAHSDVDRVAKEAEALIQNEEVNLRDSTIRAQLLAQNENQQAATVARVAKAAVEQAAVAAAASAGVAAAAVAQAQSLADEAAEALILVGIESQTRARMVESKEARGRIELDRRRFEIEAARIMGHAVVDDQFDQEVEEEGSVHGLGSNWTGRWIRESQEGQGTSIVQEGGTLGVGVQVPIAVRLPYEDQGPGRVDNDVRQQQQNQREQQQQEQEQEQEQQQKLQQQQQQRQQQQQQQLQASFFGKQGRMRS